MLISIFLFQKCQTPDYDICINSDALGVERVADLICEIAKEK